MLFDETERKIIREYLDNPTEKRNIIVNSYFFMKARRGIKREIDRICNETMVKLMKELSNSSPFAKGDI